ncbi:gamma-glutamyltransferase family protein [bacterium]|nr:gamma-glutamyltransferase family protein [bacterium]
MNSRLFSRLFLFIASVLFVTACTPTTQKTVEVKKHEGLIGIEIHAKNGVIASSHPLASAAGLEIINKGGNFMDAAVATAFALGVVEPNSSGVGGEGMMLIQLAGSNEPVVIDFRSMSPKLPGELALAGKWDNSEYGPNAIGVPGMVAGAYRAWEKYGSGKVTFAQCLEPAIRYASEGVALTQPMADRLVSTMESITSTPALAKIFMTEEGLLKEEGQRYKMEKLAETLKTIAVGGADAFYKGSLAEKMAADIQADGGMITAEDFAKYSIQETKPLKGTYKGYDIYGGSGPVGGLAVLNAMQVLDRFDLKKYPFQSAEHLNLIDEALKLGQGDHRLYARDLAFYTPPYEQLLSQEYADARASHINPETNINDDIIFAAFDTPGYKRVSANFTEIDVMKAVAANHGDYRMLGTKVAVGSEVAYLNSTAIDLQALKIPFSPDTTHLVTADIKGNVVTWTQTISYNWGSRFVSSSTGVLFNNEMNNFKGRLKKGGFKPYERMTTSIAPTIVLKDGKPYMGLGSPGGGQIVPAVMNVIINHVDYKMGLQESIEAPRFYSTLSKHGQITMEKGISEATVKKLKSFSKDPVMDSLRFNKAYGCVQAALFDWDAGIVIGGADPRRGAVSVGY